MDLGRAAFLLTALAMADGLDAFDPEEEVETDAEWVEVVIAGVDEFCKWSYQRDIPTEVAQFMRDAFASQGGES